MFRIALALAALSLAAPAAAQTLDTRAASQRTCLDAAQQAGFQIVQIARPVPIMGRLGRVLGETVRMQLAGNQGWLRCTYDIEEMRAELRRN